MQALLWLERKRRLDGGMRVVNWVLSSLVGPLAEAKFCVGISELLKIGDIKQWMCTLDHWLQTEELDPMEGRVNSLPRQRILTQQQLSTRLQILERRKNYLTRRHLVMRLLKKAKTRKSERLNPQRSKRRPAIVEVDL
jgi:hypothetical protein